MAQTSSYGNAAARKLSLLQTVRHMYGDFGKMDVVSGSGAVFHITLLFSFVLRFDRERKNAEK